MSKETIIRDLLCCGNCACSEIKSKNVGLIHFICKISHLSTDPHYVCQNWIKDKLDCDERASGEDK